MADKGDLYKSEYSGWYSVQEEAFVPEGSVDQRKGGQTVSSETGQPLEWASEVNWMFRLSKYQELLLRWHRCTNSQTPKYSWRCDRRTKKGRPFLIGRMKA